MSDTGLLFILLALFAASLLFAGNALVRARTSRREEQLRRELPLTDEGPRPSTITARPDVKADDSFWLWGLGGGGLVFFAILSWTGLGSLAALGGVLLYLVIAVPIALWLRVRRLKNQSTHLPADGANGN